MLACRPTMRLTGLTRVAHLFGDIEDGGHAVDHSDGHDDLRTGSQAETGISVRAAAAHSFTVSGFPTTVTAGAASQIVVTAYDAFGNVATGYTGTVAFSSSDGQPCYRPITPSPKPTRVAPIFGHAYHGRDTVDHGDGQGCNNVDCERGWHQGSGSRGQDPGGRRLSDERNSGSGRPGHSHRPRRFREHGQRLSGHCEFCEQRRTPAVFRPTTPSPKPTRGRIVFRSRLSRRARSRSRPPTRRLRASRVPSRTSSSRRLPPDSDRHRLSNQSHCGHGIQCDGHGVRRLQ